jgi:hypothetical protein
MHRGLELRGVCDRRKGVGVERAGQRAEDDGLGSKGGPWPKFIDFLKSEGAILSTLSAWLAGCTALETDHLQQGGPGALTHGFTAASHGAHGAAGSSCLPAGEWQSQQMAGAPR